MDAGTKLGEFIERFINTRSDIKESTRTVWKRCHKHLVRFFGADRLIATIDTGEAKDFRQHLLSRDMVENTVRKMCSVASQFFSDAADRGIVVTNPFHNKAIPRTTRENRSRDFFITREMAYRVLEACPNAEWRLLFALSRFGGLRCPSEHLAMKWADVRWDQERIIVSSPKTEHHEGKSQRVIPLFPELRPYLLAAWEEAGEKSEFVISRYRSAESNLRTQLIRIINSAGLASWPKTFHNLRASRETELAESFPMHVVCAWIGNNPVIASKHYLQVTDDHFSRAVDAMQIGAETDETKEKRNQEGLQETSDFPAYSSQFRFKPRPGMVTTGLEPATFCV
ncbi:tyrosine-type recombinase/integrase [Planctomicrobium sp. SH668]|uniref:tyrosine-type recombinase/integrase n=1 Tax=Planctomicrobium sp. SH668 TaxID=3448126 RepID=UPI003F5BEEAD